MGKSPVETAADSWEYLEKHKGICDIPLEDCGVDQLLIAQALPSKIGLKSGKLHVIRVRCFHL